MQENFFSGFGPIIAVRLVIENSINNISTKGVTAARMAVKS
jgi:hypothetical protein